MTEKYDVFISYRREGGLDHARTIFNELKHRSFRCFFDYNNLKRGKFTEGIQEAVKNCKFFVLVLTDGALDRCCSDEADWVRKEIELALSLGKTIVPVCPSGSQRNFPQGLPDSLKSLYELQISPLARDDLFDASVNAIVKDRLSGTAVDKIRRKLRVIMILVGVVFAIIIAVAIGLYKAEQARAEAARIQAEADAKANAERKAREEAIALEKRLAEEKAKAESEKKRLDEERRQAELKAKAEAEALEKRLAEEKRKADEAAKAAQLKLEEERRLADEKAKAEAEALKKKYAEEKAKAEAAAKAEAERQEQLRKQEEERKTKHKKKMNVFNSL